jgi:ABC-type Fe3+ transport system permease subunit
MPGAIFVQTLAYPTSVLMLSPAIRALDPALEEAALAAGANRWQVLRRIGLPVLRPALLSVMTILLIVGMLAFDVPAVIGIPVHVDLMSIEIFRLMTPPSGFPDYGAAAAMNALLFVVLIGGLVLYRQTIRRPPLRDDRGKDKAGASQTRSLAGRGGRLRRALFPTAVLLPSSRCSGRASFPYFGGVQPGDVAAGVLCRLCRSLRQPNCAKPR